MNNILTLENDIDISNITLVTCNENDSMKCNNHIINSLLNTSEEYNILFHSIDSTDQLSNLYIKLKELVRENKKYILYMGNDMFNLFNKSKSKQSSVLIQRLISILHQTNVYLILASTNLKDLNLDDSMKITNVHDKYKFYNSIYFSNILYKYENFILYNQSN